MNVFKLHNIRLILILGVLFFLVGFANHRQNLKPVKSLQVELLDASKIFITEAEVEKLLQEVLKSNGDSLVNEKRLASFEDMLNANEMIKSSEAFYSLDGRLSAKIIQRKPIARIKDNGFYYMDTDGLAMPLSPNYSSRVPLVSGIEPDELKEVYPLLAKIEADDFLKKHIIAIRKKSENNYVLEVRNRDYFVNFGQISYLDRKLSNYKVFYLKALEYKKLDSYKRIDLQFGNQVVCTTK
ncbi:cell division protein FtsQ [Psychroflexus sp. YR1-1]|uniref:Cell division protein FtsQ n=1 Tax=Psychroflexus aurantiacus TaxID=2709310 RepID=A0A6B3R7H7_9FLAO|nr:cell division protein FtsQ [Psychroflexus aurantiacus]NEV93751.1 cell division protein FtsQ [Psychroflexus aurantiacus]